MPGISKWLMVRFASSLWSMNHPLRTTHQKGFTFSHSGKAKLLLKSSNSGFTLIELLVAISIIGILAAVGMASLGQIQRSGRNAQRESDLRMIQSALQQYYADKNQYPNSTPTNELNRELVSGTSGRKVYLNDLPKDPTTSVDYFYTAAIDAASFAACNNTLSNPAYHCHHYQLCANREGKPQLCVKPNN